MRVLDGGLGWKESTLQRGRGKIIDTYDKIHGITLSN